MSRGRPQYVEGIYPASDIMEMLLQQNRCSLPRGECKACLRRVSTILSDMNPDGEGSCWVTEKDLARVLSDEKLNLYVLRKVKGVSRKEALKLWEAGRAAEEKLYGEYTDFGRRGVPKELLPDVGKGHCPMSSHEIDEAVRDFKIDALCRLLFDGFKEEDYREDVKRYLALDIKMSCDSSTPAAAEDATGHEVDIPMEESEREDVREGMRLEGKLGDLNNYGDLRFNLKSRGGSNAKG